MKGLVPGFALAVLMAASASAQTPAAPPPATQKPAPAPAPAPATPAAPAPAQTPAPPATPPKPFPEGAKIAYVFLQRIALESADGKLSVAKVQALQQKKAAELNERNKQLQALQQRLEKEAAVLSPTAQADLTKQAERLQVDIQRATQDAQQELQELQNQLMGQFEQRIQPILQQIGQEKGLHMIYGAPSDGLLWADPALDLSAEVVKKLDAATKAPVK